VVKDEVSDGSGQCRWTQDVNQDESLDASELLPWEHHRIPGGICGEREEDMAEG